MRIGLYQNTLSFRAYKLILRNFIIKARNTWQRVSWFRIFVFWTTDNINLKLSKWQNLFLLFPNWRRCISPGALLPKMRWDACNAVSKMYKIGNIISRNRLSSIQSPLDFAQTASAYFWEFRRSLPRLNLWKDIKKTAFRTVICRFFVPIFQWIHL